MTFSFLDGPFSGDMSIFVRVILVEESSAQKDKNIVPALKTWGYFVERWFGDWRICFFKKHPNFDLSCKRRYFEHPQNPDPSKVAIFEDLYTCYTGSNPSVGGSLGILMAIYIYTCIRWNILLIGLNFIEDTTCLATLFRQWDTTECPYHSRNPPLHPNLHFFIQSLSCWWWWMWIAV